MQKPMVQYFKPGLIHFMAFPATMKGEGPVLETIREIAKDAYFTAIEITHIKDPQVRKQVKQILDTSHMTVAYGGQPILLTSGMNINDLDESKRTAAVDRMKEAIDEAYTMGAVGFAFLSGKYQEETKDESYQALVKSTKAMCAYAQAKGSMRVVLEVFDYDIDKRSLIGPVQLAKKFADEITAEYSNFGLMVDLSHIPMLHESCEESILPIKEHIVHAHMGNTVIKSKECEAYGDMHPRFGFPDSENDVEELVEYLRVLFKAGYLNEINPPVLSFEVKPWGDEDPEIVIANAKRTLNEAWAKLSL